MLSDFIECSLDLIRMIMTYPDIKHFLFLGSYRDNEVGLDHPLLEELSALQEQGISIVSVKVGPIEKEHVNYLVSDALCLPPSLCRQLSTVIHNKTGGVILFVLSFLKSLNQEGLLWFSMSSRRWEYDFDKIKAKSISQDVVQHMAVQMARLSKQMRIGLMCAACLGPSFDKDVFEKASEKEVEESFLLSCVEYGFLDLVDSNHYKWAHDQIHQAACAYALS